MIYHEHKWRSFNKEILFPDFCKCYINIDNLITPCNILANANLKVYLTIFETNGTSISQNMQKNDRSNTQHTLHFIKACWIWFTMSVGLMGVLNYQFHDSK